MEELRKLVAAWTRLAEVLTEAALKEANPLTTAAAAEEPKKERKTRTPKEEKAPEAAASAAPATPADEAKSLTEAQNAAQAICLKFPTLVSGKPEGFHKAKKLLADEFAGSTFAKLTHEQRLKFTARVKEIISGAAPTQVGAGVGATDL